MTGAAGAPPGVAAAVLTHLRPRLATAAVRSLVRDEGFDPAAVTVVVNPPGGLDDPELEAAVRMVRLPENLGPAGGFRRALEEAFADPAVQWAYVCEDDLTLLQLPPGRLAGLLERITEAEPSIGPIGAVVPFGRRFVARSGAAVNAVPALGRPGELAPVDVSTWGATLVSRAVAEAGVLPDDALFFGFEDFDFFSRVRAAGFTVAVDVPCARRVAHSQTSAARHAVLRSERPTDDEEPWRAYYFARNFFALARRHGRPSWLAWHLLYSLRRLQLAGTGAERRAIVRGLADGVRGRLGASARYRREVGERATPAPGAGEATGAAPAPGPTGSAVDTAELAGTVLALVLSHNAPQGLRRCLAAIDGQDVRPAEVLVVDNASHPPVRLDDRPAGSVPVRVVRSEENLGPAGGWAMALAELAESPMELGWAMDDDIVPDPGCLAALLEAAAADPKAAFCCPQSVQPDGSVAPWGAWCGCLVSRRIVEDVGLPRAELFWWAEDTEYLLWRIPQAGYTRRIVDGAVVQHEAIRQGRPRPMWKYYYEARNMLWYHLHVMHRVGWYPRNITKLLARAVVRERGRRLRCLWTIGRGLGDGARGRLGLRYPIDSMRERSAA